jgi:hypothetical protein
MAYDKDKIFPLILSEIEEGASLRSILRRDDMPSRYTFFEWLHSDELKTNQYAKACELRSELIFEEILEIADQDHGTYIDDLGNVKIDSASVQKKRLQIDSRKWMLGKMNPKKYGDKLDVTTAGEKISQTPSSINVRIIENNDDE